MIFHIFLHTFGVYGPISKIFSVIESKLNFLSFQENNYDGQTAFKQVLGYFCIFHIFLHTFGVYGPISEVFQLYISKLNFLSFQENINSGQTAFLQVFGYFYIFHIFPPIFGVYGPFLKNFVVKYIKIIFPVGLSIQCVIYFDRQSVSHSTEI